MRGQVHRGHMKIVFITFHSRNPLWNVTHNYDQPECELSHPQHQASVVWNDRAYGPEKTVNVWHKDMKLELFSCYITITRGATCISLVWNNFVVLKSRLNPVPAASVAAWSEATQRNLSWKQSSEVLKSLRSAVDQRPPFIPVCLG